MSQRGGFYLVVDANVIGYTSENPLDDRTFKASQILCRILLAYHKIVLDYRQQNADSIMDEYERQVKKSQLARFWLIAMQAKAADKIAYRHRAPVHLTALSDPDDEKYFQVAVNSPHKIIISEDSDFTNIANHVQVLNLGISIWEFDLALTQL